MLNLCKGNEIGQIVGGELNNEIIYSNSTSLFGNNNNTYDSDDYGESSDCEEEFTKITLDDGYINPLLPTGERSVCYIAGPSGSGKTTYALQLIKNYLKIFPNKDFFLFSRTNYKNDTAYSGMKVLQIPIDDNLLKTPINIENELSRGSILLFDDCNTIQNDKLKKNVDKLMCDIMEVGRKLDITIIITNHLILPNEKQMGRTIMNETQYLTIFPKSGGNYQINYVLKTYFGFSKSQIKKIFSLESRWVTISKKYPLTVLFNTGCYIT